jgi:D-alanine-D-alanine ligase
MKIKVGVIFGGKSVEHEISIVTAIQAMEKIDTEKYEIIPIYITKDLEWYTGGCLRYIDSFKDYDLIRRYAKKVNLVNKDGRFILQTTGLFKREINYIDLAFPMVHGRGAEDGSIQGYLEVTGVPYVGSGVYSSAVGQDKVFMKQILEANNIDVVKYIWFNIDDYRNNKEELFEKIDNLTYPIILKPASLGSSVGIEVVKQKEELDAALDRVLKYDDKAIVEELLEDIREFNCAVLKSTGRTQVSSVEEIINDKDYRKYSDKFIWDNDDNAVVKREFPAQISKKLEEEIKAISETTFKILNNTGVARIDFLYDNKTKKVYVDEINTIPNFLTHHMWGELNINYKSLMNLLIEDAISKVKRRDNMSLTIDSDILKKITSKNIKDLK